MYHKTAAEYNCCIDR